MRIFHIVEPLIWQQARASGEYRPRSLADEGFVHCSFAGQVAATARRHFRAAEPELVVVELETECIPAPVRVERAPGTDTAFPHVYGPVPTAAQIALHELGLDPGGAWTFDLPAEGPSGDAAGAPSQPG
jgi:uncharacterized protein (DUF952 family)